MQAPDLVEQAFEPRNTSFEMTRTDKCRHHAVDPRAFEAIQNQEQFAESKRRSDPQCDRQILGLARQPARINCKDRNAQS